MTTTKEINFSYPSSPNAERFGFALKGCWTVSIWDGEHTKALAGFATPEEAAEYAVKLTMPWSSFMAKVSNAKLREALLKVTR